MIQVVDENDELSLIDVVNYINLDSNRFEWYVFDIEYSGDSYDNSDPIEIESRSKNGIKFSINEFHRFVKSINQVIEGEFICRKIDIDENYPNIRDEKESEIKILFVDGAFWEIGGKRSSNLVNFFKFKTL